MHVLTGISCIHTYIHVCIHSCMHVLTDRWGYHTYIHRYMHKYIHTCTDRDIMHAYMRRYIKRTYMHLPHPNPLTPTCPLTLSPSPSHSHQPGPLTPPSHGCSGDGGSLRGGGVFEQPSSPGPHSQPHPQPSAFFVVSATTPTAPTTISTTE